jgi:Fe-S-cluster-containing hydrogenase component 2
MTQSKFKFVEVDLERCIGCGICELACSFERSGFRTFNPSFSRIRVVRFYTNKNAAITCRACEKAPCVRACPRDALFQSTNGSIKVDESKCTGCGWCIKVCEFGCITIHPLKGVAWICDLCEGREESVVFPGRKKTSQACIEWCPEEALYLATRERVSQKAAGTSISILKFSNRNRE